LLWDPIRKLNHKWLGSSCPPLGNTHEPTGNWFKIDFNQ
jgi:hypothetical protein